MFDKLKRKANDAIEALNRKAGLPPDLRAVPAVSGVPFDQLDLALLSAYVGRSVASIEPLASYGAEATSTVGEVIQRRLRDAAAGQTLEPGELLPGLNAARMERLRAQGLTEEQLAMVQERISTSAAESTLPGFTVVFDEEHRASVQWAPIGSEDAETYDRFERQWDRENGTDGHRPEERSILSARVGRFTQGPYECYEYKNTMAAKGTRHVVLVKSPRVSSMAMVALATVALRTLGD